MSMDLYLAEKPDVAKAIAGVLNPSAKRGKGYFDCGEGRIVTWCVGHLLALQDPEDQDEKYAKWNLDCLPMQWTVQYKPVAKTKTQLNTVSRLMAQSTRIISCTDIDAAGQAIADELFEYFNIDSHKVLRALINDNNPIKIAKALDERSLRPNVEFYGLYLEEKARSVGDQRLGYNITRTLTCQAQKQGYKGKLHCGRVQSTILGLVCRRERARSFHQVQQYYNINGEFGTAGGYLKGRFQHNDHAMLDLDEKARIKNKNQAGLIQQSLHGRPAILTKLEVKKTQDSPPLPYDLLSLQAECARYYDMEPDEVLTITQKLREAPYFSISYNRSDTRYIAEENFAEAPAVLTALNEIDIFAPLIMNCDSNIKSRAWNSNKIDAHGAIIPTGSTTGWDTMPGELKAVFLLIARNYLLQFMSKRERQVADYSFDVRCDKNVSHVFNGRVQRVLKPGWSAVFKNDSDSEDTKLDDIGNVDIEALRQGEQIAKCTIESVEMQTSAPPSYIMSTLLKDLKSTAKYIEDETLKKWMIEKDKDKEGERGGVGTPATRSPILKGLFDNGFIKKNNKGKIVPTEAGMMLFDLLPKSISAPDTTAIWSHYFRQISNREITPEQFWAEVDRFVMAVVSDTKTNGLAIPDTMLTVTRPQGASQTNSAPLQESEEVREGCPQCGGEARRLNGKFGHYWKCTKCNTNYKDLAGRLFNRLCPRCRKPLTVMKPKGKKTFIGCTGYPECKHTEDPTQ